MAFSVLYLVAYHNCLDPGFAAEFIGNAVVENVDPGLKVEDLCLRSFKLSLDLAITPIKKFLFIYYIFLYASFGGAPGHSELRVHVINRDFYKKKLQTVTKGPAHSPVEMFYVSP